MKQEAKRTTERARVHMVDVTSKEKTERTALACGRIFLKRNTIEQIQKGLLPKGDVLTVSKVAGILAAKRTSDIIPMCHPISLSNVSVELVPSRKGSYVEATATVRAVDRTGVEMECLVAVTTALLTVYDMCKQVDRDMSIGEIALIEKTGGRSGHYKRATRARR